MKPVLRTATVLILWSGAAIVWADDQAAYNSRAAARHAELFQSLDRNADGLLTREESKGDLNLGPRFDDMDINRDGIVTREELQRYIHQRYGAQGSIVSSAAAR